jgi:hypothetical protein
VDQNLEALVVEELVVVLVDESIGTLKNCLGEQLIVPLNMRIPRLNRKEY